MCYVVLDVTGVIVQIKKNSNKEDRRRKYLDKNRWTSKR